MGSPQALPLLSATCDLWDYYADTAAEEGYQAGPENFGYLVPLFVADTEEKAQEIGRGYSFGGGQNGFSRPEYTLPPGYNSKGAIRAMAKASPGGSWLGISKEKLDASRSGKWKDESMDVVKEKLLASYRRYARAGNSQAENHYAGHSPRFINRL